MITVLYINDMYTINNNNDVCYYNNFIMHVKDVLIYDIE